MNASLTFLTLQPWGLEDREGATRRDSEAQTTVRDHGHSLDMNDG